MKSKNVETLIQERENLRDLLEDIMERIQEFREEVLTGLDDLEDMIQRNRIPLIRQKSPRLACTFS